MAAMAVEPPRAPGAAGMAMGSAAGLLALLDEESPSLQAEALARLDATVATSWFEARPPPAPAPAVAGTDPPRPQVAGHLPQIEALWEDEGFAARLRAALLASKASARHPPCPAPAPDMKGKTPGHRG